LINYSSRKWLQVASVVSSRAQGLVAGTDESLDSRNGKTVHRRVGTTTDRVTNILGASVVIEANKWLVSASSPGVTTINGAVSVIVTISSDVKGSCEAASHWVALLFHTLVAIVANVLLVRTQASGSIARVIGANVSIVAILGSKLAHTSGLNALINHARNVLGAVNTQASIASLSRVLAALLGIAQILGARIIIVTIERSVSASDSRVAAGNFAFISWIAGDVGEIASTDWIALIGSASIAIITVERRINTAISSNVGSAALSCAFVSVITA